LIAIKFDLNQIKLTYILEITNMNTSIQHFTNTFELQEEVIEPSSFWDENMQMIAAENLPQSMRSYCEWNTFCDRKIADWMFFAPNHVFKLPSDTSFLIAINKKNWLLYIPSSQELHLTHPEAPTVIYDSILKIDKDFK